MTTKRMTPKELVLTMYPHAFIKSLDGKFFVFTSPAMPPISRPCKSFTKAWISAAKNLEAKP